LRTARNDTAKAFIENVRNGYATLKAGPLVLLLMVHLLLPNVMNPLFSLLDHSNVKKKEEKQNRKELKFQHIH
jgi:hypothetical protein